MRRCSAGGGDRHRDRGSAAIGCAIGRSALGDGALVLVEDTTEARRRKQEIKVSERYDPRGPPSREEQPADDRLAAADPSAPKRIRRDPAGARRGDRAGRLDGRRTRSARGLGRGAGGLRPAARSVVDLVRRGAVGSGGGIEVSSKATPARSERAPRRRSRSPSLSSSTMRSSTKEAGRGEPSRSMRAVPAHSDADPVRDNGRGLPAESSPRSPGEPWTRDRSHGRRGRSARYLTTPGGARNDRDRSRPALRRRLGAPDGRR